MKEKMREGREVMIEEVIPKIKEKLKKAVAASLQTAKRFLNGC